MRVSHHAKRCCKLSSPEHQRVRACPKGGEQATWLVRRLAPVAVAKPGSSRLRGVRRQCSLIEQGVLLPRCRGCHRLFHPSRKGQRYCTSRCGDAERQRRIYRPGKRARAKAEGGNSRGRANDA